MPRNQGSSRGSTQQDNLYSTFTSRWRMHIPFMRSTTSRTSTPYKVIVKATRQPREDEEINIDLLAYFIYHRENKHWLLIKGPTSKYYGEPWYNNIKMLLTATGVQQTNTAYWYDVLEQSCVDPIEEGGGQPFFQLVSPGYLGKKADLGEDTQQVLG